MDAEDDALGDAEGVQGQDVADAGRVGCGSIGPGKDEGLVVWVEGGVGQPGEVRHDGLSIWVAVGGVVVVDGMVMCWEWLLEGCRSGGRGE